MRPQLHKQRTTSRSSGKTVNGRKDLATINPALAAESDGSWDPSTVTSGSALRVGWICRKNSAHRWTAPVSQRVSGTGCPVCVNRIIIPGVNDLATTHPELANAGDGTWDPTRYVSGSHTKLNWICSVDPRHVYLCSVNERARGVGCSLCNGKVVKAGVNDLGTLDPALAAETTERGNRVRCVSSVTNASAGSVPRTRITAGSQLSRTDPMAVAAQVVPPVGMTEPLPAGCISWPTLIANCNRSAYRTTLSNDSLTTVATVG